MTFNYMKVKQLINECDVLAFPSFIQGEKDLEKINFYQNLNFEFNKLFTNTVISINYISKDIRK